MTDRLYTQADLDAAVLAEREACAKICDGDVMHRDYIHWPAFHSEPDACCDKASNLAILARSFATAMRERAKP